MSVVLETFPSVEVADMARATSFYVRALGAEVLFSSPGWTSVRIAGVRVGLALSAGHGGARTGLHFAVAHRAAVCAGVVAAGGRVIASSVRIGPGIVVDDVTDTEGNVFALVERG